MMSLQPRCLGNDSSCQQQWDSNRKHQVWLRLHLDKANALCQWLDCSLRRRRNGFCSTWSQGCLCLGLRWENTRKNAIMYCRQWMPVATSSFLTTSVSNEPWSKRAKTTLVRRYWKRSMVPTCRKLSKAYKTIVPPKNDNDTFQLHQKS